MELELKSLVGTLDMSFNNLDGTIPVELANCTALVSMSLRQNDLEGTIPSELGSLSQLGT